MDTPLPGRGDFKAVAQHYGFNYYQIVSVLEKEPGGPSRALIVSLTASHTKLTVEEFAAVVAEKTKRYDVCELLREHDLAEENV